MNDSREQDFRQALGQFPTGVAVVTAASAGKNYALTINSFASVSLSPKLILWSLQDNSNAYDIFSDVEAFAISFLAASQRDRSDYYARSENHRLLDSDCLFGANQLPLVKGALAQFECKLHEKIIAGDHVIIIGEVTGYHSQPEETTEPLVFFSGSYRELR